MATMIDTFPSSVSTITIYHKEINDFAVWTDEEYEHMAAAIWDLIRMGLDGLEVTIKYGFGELGETEIKCQ